jgi:hypothetical protein
MLTHLVINEPRGGGGTVPLRLSALSVAPGCNGPNDLGDVGGGRGGRRLCFERDNIGIFFDSSATWGFKGTTKDLS